MLKHWQKYLKNFSIVNDISIPKSHFFKMFVITENMYDEIQTHTLRWFAAAASKKSYGVSMDYCVYQCVKECRNGLEMSWHFDQYVPILAKTLCISANTHYQWKITPWKTAKKMTRQVMTAECSIFSIDQCHEIALPCCALATDELVWVALIQWHLYTDTVSNLT